MKRFSAVATGLCCLIPAAEMLYAQDGEHWSEAVVVSSDERGPDGYSHNSIVHKHDRSVPSELMVLYSIVYEGCDTNEYVFFIRPEAGAQNE